MDWMRSWTRVRIQKKQRKNRGGGHPQGRATVCGELVKAGNASRRCIEPLDWPIIILGTHPCLFSPVCGSLLRLPCPPSLTCSVVLEIFGLL